MTKEIQKFNKTYERDISLVLEGSWVECFVHGLLDKYGFDNPYPPTFILYVNENNLQIWENKKAMNAMLDWLLEKNSHGTAFIEEVIKEYEPILARVKTFFANGSITDKEKLTEYTDLAKRGVLLFSIWYYSGYDERTPDDVKRLVVALREKDEYFASNAVYIRNCIEALGCRPDLANFVLHSEFPNVPTNEVLIQRKNSGIVVVDDKEIVFTSLKDFAEKNPEYEFEDLYLEHDDKKEVKGQVAFKGVVSGKVVIVRNYRDMERVEVGDVLVSPMTTPDFLPAMQKAGAFVTDEGGVMCHAAIVARELKKPCVTGTKHATSVFKDGDMVEVDADSGVVRIVK